MATVSLRRLWLRLHRWVALGLGWLLILAGITGAMLIVTRPLDRVLHPELFVARSTAGAPAVPLEALRQRVTAEFGPKTQFVMRPPREPGETLQINVRGTWSGTLYIDPADGREQARRGETEGFLGTLFKLHSTLLLKDTGKIVLAWAALAYLLMLATGLVLWWPRRWPPSLRIELKRGLLRGMFDLHRTGGALLGLVIAVSVASGAYMAWRPLGEFVSALAGRQAVKPPALPKVAADADAPRPTLDALAATARARFDNAPIGYIHLSALPDRPVRVRLLLPDDPHPNGISSVWLDPRDGHVLGVKRWSELDPGAAAVAYVYPLHTGELGGPLHETLNTLAGLMLAGLGVTGLWLWWKRRRG
ncbi:PepSY-associated TM helix domain-containing protein [Paucibacter sp. R3-3]|uniref:PepSY-associated TM helix domain-containing protein n=1 Tax=Roseateles agri TaxID=3098619 RepID=A0ABU5DFK6_9BURK|nr:PepSY-associated TM helix domain-containing protein [Paucibacter sp. R3-3]MDY0744909.1 PepSY-associated TM helix domain-containing protein [Paucibacter sp. R3-3]